MCQKSNYSQVLILGILLCFLSSVAAGCSQKTDNIQVAKYGSTSTMVDLSANPKHFDIGKINKVESDSMHNFLFELHNSSNKTIIIDAIEESCSCIKIQEKLDSINPGETKQLIGVANISKQSGHLSKAIFVSYNDTSLLVLRVIGDIK